MEQDKEVPADNIPSTPQWQWRTPEAKLQRLREAGKKGARWPEPNKNLEKQDETYLAPLNRNRIKDLMASSERGDVPHKLYIKPGWTATRQLLGRAISDDIWADRVVSALKVAMSNLGHTNDTFTAKIQRELDDYAVDLIVVNDDGSIIVHNNPVNAREAVDEVRKEARSRKAATKKTRRRASS